LQYNKKVAFFNILLILHFSIHSRVFYWNYQCSPGSTDDTTFTFNMFRMAIFNLPSYWSYLLLSLPSSLAQSCQHIFFRLERDFRATLPAFNTWATYHSPNKQLTL